MCIIAAASIFQTAAALDKTHKMVFDSENYYLAYSDNLPPSSGFFNEYIREGENLDNWKKIIGVTHYPEINSPEEYVDFFQKNSQIDNPHVFIKQPDTEVIFDFVISQGEITELNIFRYVKKSGIPGIFAYQFAIRNYGALTPEFQKEIAKREKWIDFVSQADFPKLLRRFKHTY